MMRHLYRMIPRLRAEDALRMSAIVAVGSRPIRNADEIVDGWRRDARSSAPRRALTRDERIAAAMNARIAVVRD
jgi:hypothetical protein